MHSPLILSGLFELADRQFLAMRREEEIKNVAATSLAPVQPLTQSDFLGFCDEFLPQNPSPPKAFTILFDEMMALNPQFQLQDLKLAFERGDAVMRAYQSKPNTPFQAKSATRMRHILFFCDQDTFANLLNTDQGQKFTSWLEANRQK
jgi:hypothetical protein